MWCMLFLQANAIKLVAMLISEDHTLNFLLKTHEVSLSLLTGLFS